MALETSNESLYRKTKVDMLITEFIELAESLNANMLELHGACNALRCATANELTVKFADICNMAIEQDENGVLQLAKQTNKAAKE